MFLRAAGSNHPRPLRCTTRTQRVAMSIPVRLFVRRSNPPRAPPRAPGRCRSACQPRGSGRAFVSRSRRPRAVGWEALLVALLMMYAQRVSQHRPCQRANEFARQATHKEEWIEFAPYCSCRRARLAQWHNGPEMWRVTRSATARRAGARCSLRCWRDVTHCHAWKNHPAPRFG